MEVPSVYRLDSLVTPEVAAFNLDEFIHLLPPLLVPLRFPLLFTFRCITRNTIRPTLVDRTDCGKASKAKEKPPLGWPSEVLL
jgi:hypothetical protein